MTTFLNPASSSRIRALMIERPTTLGTRITRRLSRSVAMVVRLLDVVADLLRDVDVDQEGKLVILQPEVLDADVAQLVADLQGVDALDPGHLLDQVDQLGLE